MTADVAPQLMSRMWAKTESFTDMRFDDTANIYDVLKQKSTFNRARLGQEVTIKYFRNCAKQLVEISLGSTMEAERAYKIIQLENPSLMHEIVSQNALGEVSESIFKNAASNRIALMKFTWLTKVAITKFPLLAVTNIHYLSEFANHVDELFVIDLFASISSMRCNMASLIEDFLIDSELIEHLVARLQEDEESVFRALDHLVRLDKVRAFIAGDIATLVQTPEIGDSETLKCKWMFYTAMLSEDTYPVMKELAGIAAKFILIATCFQQKELYCIEFIDKCCSLDSEFGDHLEGISFLALLFDSVERMPVNTSFYLTVVQLCLSLFKQPVLSKAVVDVSVPFAIRTICEREKDIPMAAISWNYLRLLTCDCPELIDQFPDGICEWIAEIESLCEADYGGDAPVRLSNGISGGELTADELISFFKEVIMTRK